MNQDQASGIKLVHETIASKKVIDMLELWLNKAREAKVVRDHIFIVESSGGMGYKKILIKNLNREKIRKIKDIANDLMNLDASDFESDEDLKI